MRLALVSLMFVSTFGFAQTQEEVMYGTVVETGTETFGTPDAVKKSISKQLKNLDLPVDNQLTDPPEIDFAAVINLGKQIWEIIEKNKPSVTISYDYANVLPLGIQAASQLQGFSNLQYRSLRTWGKNMFGSEVYSIKYTIVHRFGGNLNGIGKYLDAIAVVPQAVDVMWGYNVDFKVARVNVANVGSTSAPIASALMEAGLENHHAHAAHAKKYAI